MLRIFSIEKKKTRNSNKKLQRNKFLLSGHDIIAYCKNTTKCIPMYTHTQNISISTILNRNAFYRTESSDNHTHNTKKHEKIYVKRDEQKNWSEALTKYNFAHILNIDFVFSILSFRVFSFFVFFDFQ